MLNSSDAACRHVKTAMGFNRDKSPFILTDDFLIIMGGKQAKKSKNFEVRGTLGSRVEQRAGEVR